MIVRRDEYGVLICPDGREPAESLGCPSLPVDGGSVFCDLGMGPAAAAAPAYIGATIVTGTVPAWVEAVYGPSVASAAERALAGDPAAGTVQTLRTDWRRRPTAAARALHRLAVGTWMRRYWPSPDDGRPWATPDRTLIDLETAALAAAPELAPCFADSALARHLLRRSRRGLRAVCQDVLERGAGSRVADRLRTVLSADLALACEEAEEHGDEARLAELGALADRLDAGFDVVPAPPAGPRAQGPAVPAPSGLGAVWTEAPRGPAGGSGVWDERDTIDWGNNARALFDTRTGAVRRDVYERDGARGLLIEAPLAPGLPPGRRVPRCTARVCLEGVRAPLLVALTRRGDRMVGEAALEGTARVECVDVVSVPRPGPPRLGARREAMRAEQEVATQWAWRRGLDDVPQELPAELVPEVFDAGLPWLGELVTAEDPRGPAAPGAASAGPAAGAAESAAEPGDSDAGAAFAGPRVRLDRFVLAAAEHTTTSVEGRNRVGDLELHVVGLTASRVVVTVTADPRIARNLDVAMLRSAADGEGGEGEELELAVVLTPDAGGLLSGGTVISGHNRWVDVTLGAPRPLRDLDEDLAPVISASVRSVSTQEGRRAWIDAARTLPKGHRLRAAVREGLS